MLDATLLPPCDVAADAMAGLRATPKTLPSKLFYDECGVRLFGEITALPEYYLTRTERALLGHVAPAITRAMAADTALVEYGASDEGKAALLLDDAGERVAAYVPIDVASAALDELRARLRDSHPWLAVYPVVGDFQKTLVLPDALRRLARFGFFPGSTIGNLDPPAARGFLRTARATLGPGARMLLGADLRKSLDVLLPAYDDAAGVTAAFNLNLLRRLNREAGAAFDERAFAHEVRWNDAAGRVEMHLRSLRDQVVAVAGESVRFQAGETIHTENSHKYTPDGLRVLAREGGWTVETLWTDAGGLYALALLETVAP